MGGGASIPTRVDAEACKLLAGTKYRSELFDSLKDGSGKVSREILLQLDTKLRTQRDENEVQIISFEFDSFLTHNWGLEKANHRRVETIHRALEARGLRPWFDADRMRGTVRKQMCNGIDNSKCVVVFITEIYQSKVTGENEYDNCQFEFNYACNRRKPLLPVVMEKSMSDTSQWMGQLSGALGAKLYIDMSFDFEKEKALFERRCDDLVEAIRGLVGTTCLDDENRAISRLLETTKISDLSEALGGRSSISRPSTASTITQDQHRSQSGSGNDTPGLVGSSSEQNNVIQNQNYRADERNTSNGDTDGDGRMRTTTIDNKNDGKPNENLLIDNDLGRKPIASLSVDEVVRLFKSYHGPQFESSLEEFGVDGRVLAAVESTNELLELGIKLPTAKLRVLLSDIRDDWIPNGVPRRLIVSAVGEVAVVRQRSRDHLGTYHDGDNGSSQQSQLQASKEEVSAWELQRRYKGGNEEADESKNEESVHKPTDHGVGGGGGFFGEVRNVIGMVADDMKKAVVGAVGVSFVSSALEPVSLRASNKMSGMSVPRSSSHDESGATDAFSNIATNREESKIPDVVDRASDVVGRGARGKYLDDHATSDATTQSKRTGRDIVATATATTVAPQKGCKSHLNGGGRPSASEAKCVTPAPEMEADNGFGTTLDESFKLPIALTDPQESSEDLRRVSDDGRPKGVRSKRSKSGKFLIDGADESTPKSTGRRRGTDASAASSVLTTKCRKLKYTLQGHSDVVRAVVAVDHPLHRKAHGMGGVLDGLVKYTDSLLDRGSARRDDAIIVSASYDKSVNVWSASSGECVRTWDAHTDNVTCLIALEDGTIVTGSADKKIKKWDPQSGKCLLSIDDAHSATVRCLASLLDGRIITCSRRHDSKLKIWDTTTGKLLSVIEENSDRTNAIIRLKDGTVATACTDGHIRLWDMHTPFPSANATPRDLNQFSKVKRCSKMLHGHSFGVTALIELTNGFLASGSDDKTIRIWDWRVSGDCIRTLHGHHFGVTCLAVLADGVTLLSGSVGCSIRAWDTDSGECIEVIGDKEEEGGHADSVLCLCVLPDGNSVVSGSVDNTVKIWSR